MGMDKLSIRDIEIENQHILVRVDFNVPLDGDRIVDDTRIRASLPTIRHILDNKGVAVLMSHLGRPNGKVVPELSLKQVAECLARHLGSPVQMAPDCVGEETDALVKCAAIGSVVLLENLRFHAAEENNDPGFALQLCEYGSAYVNDAFGTAHRAHASTEGVTHNFVSCAAGFLMEKELQYLGGALTDPSRPFVGIMGGAKVSGKIDVIDNLLPRLDSLLIGGGMAYTFFKAMGLEIGKSLLDADRIGTAEMILQKAGAAELKLVFPEDCVVAAEISEGVETRVVPRDQIPSDLEALDIGPATRAAFAAEVARAGTVIWNGPLGVFEVSPFEQGTKAVAEALVEATKKGTTTIVGGGETAAAVKAFGLEGGISHVSTGGGASLEFLEGKILPGVAALSEPVASDEPEENS
jgi:phosphoglycerate kinase